MKEQTPPIDPREALAEIAKNAAMIAGNPLPDPKAYEKMTVEEADRALKVVQRIVSVATKNGF